MPLYAYFNHSTSDPSPVLGWYDTDTFSYASLPDFRDLLEVSTTQWNNRLTNPSGWAVSGGVLVSYTPPVPLPLQAQNMLAQKLANGIVITSSSLPAVNGTYALDSASTNQIFQIGSFTNSFGVFPNGGVTQAYPDINGVPHVFTTTIFVAFLRAVAALISNMQTQTSIMANGGTPIWPQQAAALG